jgi:hypothetical protein
MPIDFELSQKQLGLWMQAREFGDQTLKHAPLHDVDQGMLRSCFVGRRALVTNEIVRSAKLFLDDLRTEVRKGQSKATAGSPRKHRSNARRKRKA